MFRLAHISDPHLGPLPKVSPGQLASKRITGYVNWRLSRHRNHRSGAITEIGRDMADQNPTHIAVSGDLINLGLESEMEQAREWLSELGDSHNVSVVPGNHDAYVPGAFDRLCQIWRPWVEGDDSSHLPDPFPYIRVRDQVAVIGVSSARATAPFMATGYFRHHQAIALAKLLEDAGRQGLCRVIMIHHPPFDKATAFYKRLVGIGQFQQVIREHGAELVLHGHTHLPTLAWIRDENKSVPVVGVSAGGQAIGGLLPPAQLNLFDIDGAPGDWQITLARRGLGGKKPGVTELKSEVLLPR